MLRSPMARSLAVLGLLAACHLAEPDRGANSLPRLDEIVELVDPSGYCVGTPIDTKSVPLGQCLPIESAGSREFFLAFCSGNYLLGLYYPAASGGCVGAPTPTSLPLEKCSKIAGSAKGESVYVTCQSGAFTVTTFSSTPPMPVNLQCNTGIVASGALPVACNVDPSLVDEVSFEVGLPGGRPFLGFTAVPDGEGRVQAAIPGVRGGARYQVAVRSHRRGGLESNLEMWSDISAKNVTCRISARGGPATRWIEVYRIAGGELADFLDQHNTGDDTVMFAALAATAPPEHAITRYCVEMADVTLPGVVTASVSGEAQASPFADYLSCNGGNCECMHQVDRTISRFPAKQILGMCSHPYVDASKNTCRCPASMDTQSLRYVGRCPIPFPFSIYWSMEQLPVKIPPGYPPSFHASPIGHFYSFPAGGRCPPGARVGEGNCTWQLSPLAYTLHGDDLRRMGLNDTVSYTYGSTKQVMLESHIDYEASMHNIPVGRKAFAELGMAPCGPGAAEAVAGPGSPAHAGAQPPIPLFT